MFFKHFLHISEDLFYIFVISGVQISNSQLFKIFYYLIVIRSETIQSLKQLQ